MTEANPIFKTPGYAEKKAEAKRICDELVVKLEKESADSGEIRLLPVTLAKGLPDPTPYREEPWHRHAALAYATGYSAKDIAQKCDKSLSAVYQLQKKKEFQAMVTALVEERGGFVDIMEAHRAEVMASLATLVELRDDEKTPRAVRANISLSILERVMGKTKQHVEHSGEIKSGDPVAEHARLLAQNSSLREGLVGGPN